VVKGFDTGIATFPDGCRLVAVRTISVPSNVGAGRVAGHKRHYRGNPALSRRVGIFRRSSTTGKKMLEDRPLERMISHFT
jgi:hypothetical protein